MSGPSATTSIIICAYTLERWDDICEAVQSARLQEPAATEIVLVCDHNPKLEAMCKARFSDVVVVGNGEPAGLSGARNSGIAAARGAILVFLDDDAVADKHFVARLAAHCRQPDVIAASARAEPVWLAARPSWFPDEFLWVVGCTHSGTPQSAGPIRNALGGAMCMRREVFEKVGGFSHRLGRTSSKVPISCEETELCIRARRALPTSRIMYEPTALIHHKVTAKRLTLRYFALRCYAEGLSKAYVANMLGSSDTLALERRYLQHTILRGFLRELGDAVTLRDWRGLGRAGAIVCGLISATAGFGVGKVRWRGRLAASKAALLHARGTGLFAPRAPSPETPSPSVALTRKPDQLRDG
jgi:GT2 family glycosyltransferase